MTNANCSGLFMRNLRIWKIGKTSQEIQSNIFKNVDGSLHNYLIYNLNFDNCDISTNAYNYVRTWYVSGTNPINMVDGYNIISLQSSATYATPPLVLNLCKSYQTKSIHEELCYSKIFFNLDQSTGQSILTKFLRNTQITLQSQNASTGASTPKGPYLTGEFSIEFWVQYQFLDNSGQNLFSIQYIIPNPAPYTITSNISTSLLKLTLSTTNLITMNTTINSQQWCFMAFSFSIINNAMMIVVNTNYTTKSLTLNATDQLALINAGNNQTLLTFNEISALGAGNSFIYLNYLLNLKIYRVYRSPATIINESHISAVRSISNYSSSSILFDDLILYLPLTHGSSTLDLSVYDNKVNQGNLIDSYPNSSNGYFYSLVPKIDSLSRELILCEGDMIYDSINNICYYKSNIILNLAIGTGMSFISNNSNQLKIAQTDLNNLNMNDVWFMGFWFNQIYTGQIVINVIQQNCISKINLKMSNTNFIFIGNDLNINLTIPIINGWNYYFFRKYLTTMDVYTNQVKNTFTTALKYFWDNNCDITFANSSVPNLNSFQLSNFVLGNYFIDDGLINSLSILNPSRNDLNLIAFFKFDQLVNVNQIYNYATYQSYKFDYTASTTGISNSIQYGIRDYIPNLNFNCPVYSRIINVSNYLYTGCSSN